MNEQAFYKPPPTFECEEPIKKHKKKKKNHYWRMLSWAPVSIRMFLGAQKSIWCAINLVANLLQVTLEEKKLKNT
jgi:hypothetical protein